MLITVDLPPQSSLQLERLAQAESALPENLASQLLQKILSEQPHAFPQPSADNFFQSIRDLAKQSPNRIETAEEAVALVRQYRD